MKLKGYACHSGGAIGSDACWERFGVEYGVKTNAYSFEKHKTAFKETQVIITQEDLDSIDPLIKKTEKLLKRRHNKKNLFVANLVRRNAYQIFNSDSVFAISTILDLNDGIVDGGTGWAIGFAILLGKENIHVFCQQRDKWYKWKNGFFECETPILTKNFAGIGSRDILDNGIEAIKDVYKKTTESLI